VTHFVNDIGSVISESIDGYLQVSSGGMLSRVADAGVKIVLQQTIDRSKVSLISGGGSGHEPAHVGFVGQGMLTAAVCGEIFASPSVEAVLTAIRAVTGPAGCLLIVKNYAGDRLNFGLAAERARAEGFRVEMVIVADDVAIQNAPRPRGIAGTLFVHKIAGYAAVRGRDLAAVKSIGEKVASAVRSIGIASTVCSIPGRAIHNRLPDGMAELGLGIHGEPGIERIALPNASDAASMMTDRLGPGLDSALPLAMIINNLGGMPAIEMSLVANAILATGMGRRTTFVIGPAPLMTALDMRGFSISVLPLDEDFAESLLAPTSAPAWPGARTVVPVSEHFSTKPLGANYRASPNPEARRVLEVVCSAIIGSEDELNLLDAKVGDGDTGTTLAGAARSVLSVIDQLPLNNGAQLCAAVSDQFTKIIGGSSGVLLSILFAATSLKLAEGAAWPSALNAGLDRMEYYGGAREGDRTMLDAFRPAIRALESGEGLNGAALAAEAGAAKTAKMSQARAGRSSYLASRDLDGVPDPGAMAVAKAFGALQT